MHEAKCERAVLGVGVAVREHENRDSCVGGVRLRDGCGTVQLCLPLVVQLLWLRRTHSLLMSHRSSMVRGCVWIVLFFRTPIVVSVSELVASK
eukprot:5859623-Prymnesium_polylepis.2